MSNDSLTLLISAEKKYLDTLIFIDSQLSPLWMKQFKSAAPDFSELLLCIQNILKVNKPFYKKLSQMKSQNELGKVLMQWVIDIKEPYEHYSKQYIHNLNQRKEICTTSIQRLLHKLSSDTTLETLFDAPLEQLVTYKSLFNRLSFIDPAVLIEANKVISFMINRITCLNSIHFRIDCSQVKNIETMELISKYQLPSPVSLNIIRDDVFHTTDSLLSTPIRLILTQDVLYYLKDREELVYPPIPVADVSIRAALPERELVGEYSIELVLYKHHTVLLQTPSKPIRHEWLNDDESSELRSIFHVAQLVPQVESPISSRNDIHSEKNDEIPPESSASCKLEASKNSEEKTPDCRTPPPKPVSKTLPNNPQQSFPNLPAMVVHNRDSDINKTNPVPVTLSPSSSTTMASKKRNSFMKTVLSVVSKSTLRGQKQSDRASSLKKGSNISSVSLEPPHQRDSSLQQRRRFSQFPQAENDSSPSPPQHLTLPNSPYAHNLNQSTPSFNSTLSSSQTSISLSPPLSRASSPASKYPTTPTAEDFGSPPASPDSMTNGNTIRQVLFSSKECQIFRWKDESWYAVEEQNQLQVRQTYSNRSCLAVELEPSGEVYLNAWILPDTFIHRISATDLTVSMTMGASQAENYLIHCATEDSTTQLLQILEKMHAVSQTINNNNNSNNNNSNTLRGEPPVLSRSSSLPTNAPKMTAEELQKTLRLAMQCKCKLYVQNETSKWHSFGSVHLKISNQWTTRKMHIDLSSHKSNKVTQLVSSMVQSRNVERLGPKRISFLLIDEVQKTNVVYMIQVREELTGDKILEYIKSKNAENGW